MLKSVVLDDCSEFCYGENPVNCEFNLQNIKCDCDDDSKGNHCYWSTEDFSLM